MTDGDGEKTFVSPVVARIASEHDVDISQVSGTGRGGRVTKKDIMAFVESGPAAPSVQMVNSRSLVIDFEVKDMGPSGVGVVELWYTRDGQTWAKSPGAPQRQSPFVLDVIVPYQEHVLPMIPSGMTVRDIIKA